MKPNLANLSILLMALAWLPSCDRPGCTGTNPVFEKYPPDSREYRAELSRQLETVDRSKLTFWFREYRESDGEELLLFDVRGEGMCAMLVLHVEQWGKLQHVRRAKGVSFRGAEFRNLQFDTRQDSSGTRFVFRDYSGIVD